jgi:hypothetical protein
MQEATFTLNDDNGNPLKVKVRANNNGLSIMPEGYGDNSSEDGHGVPVILDWFNNKLQVVVWKDINKEDPVWAIDLSDAKESNRKEEV